jgi:hypothetical protein
MKTDVSDRIAQARRFDPCDSSLGTRNKPLPKHLVTAKLLKKRLEHPELTVICTALRKVKQRKELGHVPD